MRLKLLEERIKEAKLQLTDVEQRLIVFRTRGIMDRELTRLEKIHLQLRTLLNALLEEKAMLSAPKPERKAKKNDF